jgi:hypothetical protein
MHKTLLDSAIREAPRLFRRNAVPEDQTCLSEAAMARIRREILRNFLARLKGEAARNTQATENL